MPIYINVFLIGLLSIMLIACDEKKQQEDIKKSPLIRVEPITQELQRVFKVSEEQYNKLVNKKAHKDVIVVVNMRQPSNQPRLYLYNTKTRTIKESFMVTHGRGSNSKNNKLIADNFSNVNNSYKSSLGGMLTANVYNGQHGKSLRLIGIERGINNNIYKRLITMHGAKYVSQEYYKENGTIGNSLGCLAVDKRIAAELIDKVKNGTFIYVYY